MTDYIHIWGHSIGHLPSIPQEFQGHENQKRVRNYHRSEDTVEMGQLHICILGLNPGTVKGC